MGVTTWKGMAGAVMGQMVSKVSEDKWPDLRGTDKMTNRMDACRTRHLMADYRVKTPKTLGGKKRGAIFGISKTHPVAHQNGHQNHSSACGCCGPNPALVLVKQRSKMGDSRMGSGSAPRTGGTLESHQEQLEILPEVEPRGGAL